jgi:hypothetical protein
MLVDGCQFESVLDPVRLGLVMKLFYSTELWYWLHQKSVFK